RYSHQRYMRTLRLVLFICAATAAAMAAPCGGHGDKSTMLVSTAWLADHLHDANLTILAIAQGDNFPPAHIPGALQLLYDDIHLMQTPNNLSVEVPPLTQLRDVFRKLGVNNDSRIVLYFDTPNLASITTRSYLTLDAMGLGARASILDGGLAVWK